MRRLSYSFLSFIVLSLAVFVFAFLLGRFVASSSEVQLLIQEFGYAGILTVSFISGLNLFVPIHVGAFVPAFTSAGFPIINIIVVMIIGTFLADIVGYAIGFFGHTKIRKSRILWVKKVIEFSETHTHFILPILFLWAALVPLPNEFLVIPFALLGVGFVPMGVVLLLGNMVNITLVALGITSIVDFFS